MNILIPDSWLRDFLKTKATPKDIQRCVSLCGPSVERINKVENDFVYDVEITTNRVDAYSVYGFAREAAAILPEFGYAARLLPFPLKELHPKVPALDIKITDHSSSTNRVLAIKLENVTLAPSPKWLTERLEKVGQRPLNNIIDITNYVMWETGHPAHAFDYDRLREKHIIIREAKQGEKLVTLDGKKYTLRGGEVLFDDGTGTIIDLPGVMGTLNTIVTNETKNVLLFIENTNPAKIRYASMGLSIRTQAATINEKGPDPTLAYTTIRRAIDLTCELTHGRIGSKLYDHYIHKPTIHTVSVSGDQLSLYLGTEIKPHRVITILKRLGFSVTSRYSVRPPTWRAQDIKIPEDVIEEVARIYGYHNIQTKLPQGEPPVVLPDPQLAWEQEIKVRLRDWGFTELYTYSMISQKLMDIFGLDPKKAYKISNPLSEEWVYMRPHLFPSVLAAVEQNLHVRDSLKLFELSIVYRFRPNDLPQETPSLIVVWTGEKFREAKGIAEALFQLFGVPVPLSTESDKQGLKVYTDQHLSYGSFGSVGVVHPELLAKMNIHTPVTRVYLDIFELVKHANPIRKYVPIAKYPPIIEDLSFIVPEGFQVGPLIEVLSRVHKLIESITFLDAYENKRTFRVTYSDPTKTLTGMDIAPIRQKLIEYAGEKFGAMVVTA